MRNGNAPRALQKLGSVKESAACCLAFPEFIRRVSEKWCPRRSTGGSRELPGCAGDPPGFRRTRTQKQFRRFRRRRSYAGKHKRWFRSCPKPASTRSATPAGSERIADGLLLPAVVGGGVSHSRKSSPRPCGYIRKNKSHPAEVRRVGHEPLWGKHFMIARS